MRRIFLFLAGAAAVAAACADGGDPGTPVLPPGDEAGALDATIAGFDAGPPPDAPADPPPGDTCGDRAGLQANAPWVMGGGCPTRSGVTLASTPQQSLTHIAYAYAGSESAPVVGADGTTWVGTNDGIVYAIANSFTSARARKIANTAIRSTAAIAANGNAIIGSPDGALYALRNTVVVDPDAGTDAGTDAGDDAGSIPNTTLGVAWSLPTPPIVSSPAIAADGTIFAGTTTGKLLAIVQTPKIVWSADTGDTFGSSPALARDGTIYVGSTDHALHAFTPDGKPKWTTDLGAEIKASPAIGGDGTIYCGTTEGKLFAIDPLGAVKWTYPAGAAILGTPAIYAGGVYVPAANKMLHGVNVLDGKPRWTFTTLGTPSSAIVTEAGNVYFGSTDGKLYVTTPKGGLFFAAAARGTVTSAPAINASGFMLFSTDKGLLLLGQ